MKTLNLRNHYDELKRDTYIDTTEKIADTLEESKKKEQAYMRKKYRYKAQYSLDCNDGIAHTAVFVSLSPEEIYERKLTNQQLYAAISELPDKQAKRIYAYFFMGMSKMDIANAEGVSEGAIRASIQRGLNHMEKILKNNL